MKKHKKISDNESSWMPKVETDYAKHQNNPGLPKEVFKEKEGKKAGYTLVSVLVGILIILLIAWIFF